MEGELSVANFLVNYFKRGPFPAACGTSARFYSKVPLLTGGSKRGRIGLQCAYSIPLNFIL
jgi:hypothetical protein